MCVVRGSQTRRGAATLSTVQLGAGAVATACSFSDTFPCNANWAKLAGMPDFPAKEARGMRNVLVHDYDGVNVERLWDTATQDIPLLRKAVEKYLQADTQSPN